MKANYNRPISKAIRNRVRTEVGKEIRRQAGGLSRRMFKLFCFCLNDEYGFGKERLSRLITKVSELSARHETDEAFWTHVDKRIEQIGITFEKENYEEMDR